MKNNSSKKNIASHIVQVPFHAQALVVRVWKLSHKRPGCSPTWLPRGQGTQRQPRQSGKLSPATGDSSLPVTSQTQSFAWLREGHGECETQAQPRAQSPEADSRVAQTRKVPALLLAAKTTIMMSTSPQKCGLPKSNSGLLNSLIGQLPSPDGMVSGRRELLILPL